MNLKYYLHKHILTMHSIDVELDEIKMKRDRKNKIVHKAHPGPSPSKLLAEIKRKEKHENTVAYRNTQKLKQAVRLKGKKHENSRLSQYAKVKHAVRFKGK